jgi:hypothetical protein
MNGTELPRKIAIAVGITFVALAAIYFTIRIFTLVF